MQVDIFSDYSENHGEEPSIEAEKKRKPKRAQKAKEVSRILHAMRFGPTAGEIWERYEFSLKENGMKDIYDLRRTLSMMKKKGLLWQGRARKCKATGAIMFPWRQTSTGFYKQY